MDNGIVMESKISILRNIENYPFPHKLSDIEAEDIVNKVKSILVDSVDICNDLALINMKEASNIEKNNLIERRIISKKFSENENGALLYNQDKTIIILINDDNHISINVSKSDSDLNQLYNIANKIEDIMGEKIDFAFNNEIGYLTSCPVNAGTGLKTSIIIHLPILSLQDEIENYRNIASKIGANIKGINSEKANTLGNMYEVINQRTHGKSEKNIIESINSLTKDLINNEIEARNNLKQYTPVELEDNIFRSLGILQNARIISSYEAMKHLSNVKLGIEIGYINDINKEKVNSLMMGLKPSLRILSYTNESDIQRANYIREELSLGNRNNK